MKRRDFLQALAWLGLVPILPGCRSVSPDLLYRAPNFGNMTVCHLTDCHAQLLPVYYREPDSHPDDGAAPYFSGMDFLRYFGIRVGSREAHAFTHLDFAELAKVYGKMGGFAYLATLLKQIRQDSAHGNVLLLDGGDSWQGSATGLWTNADDMVQASNLLGVDMMTGHWEFTYGERQVKKNLERFKGEFIAQNVALSEEAQFAADSDATGVFKPYVIKSFNGARVAVIGQAYPYTPIANPADRIPNWQFGIQEQRLQKLVDGIRQDKSADAIILLSHNGLSVDLKLAQRVTGLDVILGGHTHDALPRPVWVNNPGGRTCVTNAGSHGKFLAVLDLDIRNGRLQDLRYRLLPVFANLLSPDSDMQRLIETVRQPYTERLSKPLAVADKLLYRRDTRKGTFDDILLQALLHGHQAQIAMSPGFRWGATILPGQVITYEDVMNHTAITYPETQARSLTGAEIKGILEDAADNVFNPDPYYQQGGDMVRVGGLSFRCRPQSPAGSRISDMRLTNGTLMKADKNYRVASWAAVKQPIDGAAMADLVVDYLGRR
jgi:S-sulfosulfanyl-L-cysteine sulfohydrolase